MRCVFKVQLIYLGREGTWLAFAHSQHLVMQGDE